MRHPAAVTGALAALARRQAGVFSHAQALAAGVPARTISRRVAALDWVRVQPRVYCEASLPLSQRGRFFAIWLSVGAPMAFTGPAGAVLWEVRRVRSPLVALDLAVPDGRWPGTLSGVRLHRVPALGHVQVQQGFPVLPLPRVLVDLAAVVTEPALRDIVQEVLRLRLCTPQQLAAVMGRGRRGSARLRSVLAVVADGADSVWERRLAKACLAEGLPPPTRPLLRAPASGRYLRPDLYWQGVVVEVDGVLAHSSGRALAEDDRRQNALIAELGLVVLRYTPADIRDRTAEVVAEIARVVRAAAARTA